MKNADISIFRIGNSVQLKEELKDLQKCDESSIEVDFVDGSYHVISNKGLVVEYIKNMSKDIPVKIKESQVVEIKDFLLEELKTKKLNPMQMAIYINELDNICNMKKIEVAQLTGLSQGTISNKNRLMKLPIKIQNMMLKNQIKERQGRVLLKLIKDPEYGDLCIKFANKFIEDKLKVEESEIIVNEYLGLKTTKRNSIAIESSKKNDIHAELKMVDNHINKQLNELISKVKMQMPNLDIELVEGVENNDLMYLLKVKGNDNG